MKKSITWIIADNYMARVTASRAIAKLGENIKVVTFFCEQQAFQFLMDNPASENRLPDLIFVDTNMPFIDGYDFIDIFEKIKPHFIKQVKAYSISSATNAVEIEGAIKFNLSGYLKKNIRTETFASGTELVDNVNESWVRY